jgi:uncharacterized membrane protein YjdF
MKCKLNTAQKVVVGLTLLSIGLTTVYVPYTSCGMFFCGTYYVYFRNQTSEMRLGDGDGSDFDSLTLAVELVLIVLSCLTAMRLLRTPINKRRVAKLIVMLSALCLAAAFYELIPMWLGPIAIVQGCVSLVVFVVCSIVMLRTQRSDDNETAAPEGSRKKGV